MSIEFDRCPICGSEMMLVRIKDRLTLQCTGCPLDFGRSWYSRKRDIRRAWNRRVGEVKEGIDEKQDD